MVELLASALTGGDFSVEAAPGKPEGAVSTQTGQFVLLIDPNRGGSGDFADALCQSDLDTARCRHRADSGRTPIPGPRRG